MNARDPKAPELPPSDRAAGPVHAEVAAVGTVVAHDTFLSRSALLKRSSSPESPAGSERIALDEPPSSGGAAGRQRGLPSRFWLYAAAVLLYGVCETLFGNWSTLYLDGQRGLSTTVASLALATFWAMVTVGRIAIAALTARVAARTIYVALPVIMAAAFLSVAAASARPAVRCTRARTPTCDSSAPRGFPTA